MRTRNHDWYDTKNNTPLYGFQVLDGGVWKHYAEDGKPCIYATPNERNVKRTEIRKKSCL